MFKINLLYKSLISIAIGLLLSSCGSNEVLPEGNADKGKIRNSSSATNIIPIPSSSISQKTISVNGKERKFSLYIPDNVIDGASIVFLYHGSSKLTLPAGPIYLYEKDKFIFNKIAIKNNIIMVYPVGIESYGELRWDPSEDSADLEFFDKMVDYLSTSLKKDHGVEANMKKLYSTGYSSGAIFSFALAGYRVDKITAVTTLAGQFTLSRDDKTVSFIDDDISIPLRAYNGTNDRRVQYMSAYDNMKKWHEKENKGKNSNPIKSNIEVDRLVGSANDLKIIKYDVEVAKFQGGLSDLEMYSIKDGTHSQDWINFGDSMWEFMNRYERH